MRLLICFVLLQVVASIGFASVIPPWLSPTSDYDTESHPADSGNIKPAGDNILGFISNGTWVGFENRDFGTGVSHAFIEVSTPNSSVTTIQLRTGSSEGPIIGSIDVTDTGGFNVFKVFDVALSQPLVGVQNLYLTFSGGGGYLVDTRFLWFEELDPNLKIAGSAIDAAAFDSESHPDASPVIANSGILEGIEYGTWVAFDDFDFGTGADQIEIEGTAAGKGGQVELRLGAADGPLTAAVDISHTGSWTFHRLFNGRFPQSVSGTHDVFLRFVNTHGNPGELFRLKRFSIFRSQPPVLPASHGRLSVYPPVPGLAPSPYYSFSVQKLSDLNAPLKKNATNWLQPFAWFTQCVEKTPENAGIGYFEEFIGSWSHSYCNFEVDPRMPIVVRIKRLEDPGAPSGPIVSAVARPAHKVISCEVIDGDVYVTMSEPGLIAVDIDGQMEGRDAPRAIPDTWSGNFAPYTNELSGSHGVSIFANPFIEDKPDLSDPTVLAVEPGTLPPSDGPWKTLYFKPGIHKFSVDAQGNEREWEITDPLFLRNGKQYYISGDAIVYGMLSDVDDDLPSSDIRVFGHGTLCGTKAPHFTNFLNPAYPLSFPDKDYSTPWRRIPPEHNGKLRMLSLSKADNCHFEGITLMDPPEHGFRMYDDGNRGNSLRWLKNISWRVNNDGASVSGKSVLEDCFFRHQDDALYVDGATIRRCVFWSDVNGVPLRCDFITRNHGHGFPYYGYQDLLVEDCDIIYTRGLFAFSGNPDFGVITAPNGWDNLNLADGTLNTAQNLVFRNIRVSDPKPQRYLFGFVSDPNQAAFSGWAGIRFENIDYQHPHTWGWKNRILGTPGGPARYWSFSNVRIAGQLMDAGVLADPLAFETSHVSDIIFKTTSHTLTTAVSGEGYLSASPAGASFAKYTPIRVTATPAPGHLFSSWAGALDGSAENPATLVLDEDKSVTAVFVPSGGEPNVLIAQINCGGGDYTAEDGTLYVADANFNDGSTHSTNDPIAGTLDDPLYQTERFGGNFSYAIPVPDGNYEVTLKFAEIFFESTGSRIFSATIEGIEAISNLDLWQTVGKNTAHDVKHLVTVNDGMLNIVFSATANNAKISAIKVMGFSSPGLSYQSWSTMNAGGGGPDEDFDNDGMKNGIEYFMGESGNTHTPNPTIVAGRIRWPRDPSVNADYAVEVSTDLQNWDPTATGLVDHGDLIEYVLPGDDSHFFVRLRVIIPPESSP